MRVVVALNSKLKQEEKNLNDPAAMDKFNDV